jgi:hypothetical protein
MRVLRFKRLVFACISIVSLLEVAIQGHDYIRFVTVAFDFILLGSKTTRALACPLITPCELKTIFKKLAAVDFNASIEIYTVREGDSKNSFAVFSTPRV